MLKNGRQNTSYSPYKGRRNRLQLVIIERFVITTISTKVGKENAIYGTSKGR
jgi:hypothetical protein